MNRLRDALAVSPQYIETQPVYVLLIDGGIAGFFGFITDSEETLLNDFWLEPQYIRTGLGRAMWQYALDQARAHGFQSFLIQSDPNAEGFYLHAGAQRIGTRIAPETGRALPLLRSPTPACGKFRCMRPATCCGSRA